MCDSEYKLKQCLSCKFCFSIVAPLAQWTGRQTSNLSSSQLAVIGGAVLASRELQEKKLEMQGSPSSSVVRAMAL